jgi:hypothetical protein
MRFGNDDVALARSQQALTRPESYGGLEQVESPLSCRVRWRDEQTTCKETETDAERESTCTPGTLVDGGLNNHRSGRTSEEMDD